jgi:protein subunit release factor B
VSIQSQRQLENTRKKLQLLEGRLKDLQAEPAANPRTRDLTKHSLKKLINQMKEEIARFAARGSIHSAD